MIELPEEFLPLGSVVRLEGGDKTMMVVGRALIMNKDDGTREYYDYGLILYPEGVMGDALIYSNHDKVKEVLWRGFEDESNGEWVTQLTEILPQMDIPKGNPKPADEW